MLPQQRLLASVFLMLPALRAVAVSLGARHAVALRTSFRATARLMAIAVCEALCQYLLGPSGQVPVTLLHFLEKLHELLISGLLRVLEILHTRLAALEGVIEHADDVVNFVPHTGFMLSRSRCASMACHVAFLHPAIYVYHT